MYKQLSFRVFMFLLYDIGVGLSIEYAFYFVAKIRRLSRAPKVPIRSAAHCSRPSIWPLAPLVWKVTS